MSEIREDTQASSFERPLSQLTGTAGVTRLSAASLSTADPTNAVTLATSAIPAISVPPVAHQTCRRGRFCRWLSRLLRVPDDSVQAQVQELDARFQVLLQHSQEQARRNQDLADQFTLYTRQCQLERKLCQNERLECQDERHQSEVERKRCQDARRQLLLETKKAERLNKETEARHNELDNLMQVEEAESSGLKGYSEAALRALGRGSHESWT